VSERAIGAVLAGGASRRMGVPKATLELAGRPLAARAVDLLQAAGLEPVVVAKPGSPLPALEARVIAEPEEPRHPLTGIVAALRETRRPVVVLGCDMPLAPPPLLAHLARLVGESGCRAVVVEVGGALEPLLASYDPACADALGEALAERLPLRDAVASLAPERLGEDELRGFGDPDAVAFNVNSPADLERAAKLVSRRARP
jgi:molybdopterin-guanine dinucleotide biosynthesis protein A